MEKWVRQEDIYKEKPSLFELGRPPWIVLRRQCSKFLLPSKKTERHT